MRTSVAIATFFCIWFITLFAVLPFGVRTQDEEGSIVPGTPGSAPHSVRMLRVFMINTVVAAVVFAGVYALVAHLNG